MGRRPTSDLMGLIRAETAKGTVCPSMERSAWLSQSQPQVRTISGAGFLGRPAREEPSLTDPAFCSPATLIMIDLARICTAHQNNNSGEWPTRRPVRKPRPCPLGSPAVGILASAAQIPKSRRESRFLYGPPATEEDTGRGCPAGDPSRHRHFKSENTERV